MTDFIAEVTGKEDSDEGIIVTVRMTGFGDGEGALMTRAKGRAIASARFGPDQATYTKSVDVQGMLNDVSEDKFADKSEGLFTGPAKGVRERIKTFRKNGLFAQVEEVKEVTPQGAVFKDGRLEEEFGHMAEFVNTYRYKVLVTTKYSFK